MAARVPAVYLSDFNYTLSPSGDTASVKISGISSNREAILSFADNLRKTHGVTAVDVPITNFIKESNMPFSITIVEALK